MAKPTAEKIELDETPFSTFVTKHVPEAISFAFNATGAALAAGKLPPLTTHTQSPHKTSNH